MADIWLRQLISFVDDRVIQNDGEDVKLSDMETT